MFTPRLDPAAGRTPAATPRLSTEAAVSWIASYADNVLGNIAATAAAAEKGSGDYPVGSVLPRVPNEVMIKQPKGFSPPTRAWEFFFVDVNEQGSKIYKRGFAEVNNRFGGNCFACHVKVKPEFDFVCEQAHGCARL